MSFRLDTRLVILTVLVAFGLFGVAGAVNTSSSGFYLNVQQNVTIESGQYYTIFAQAGSHAVSHVPYPVPLTYSYQWYNTTGGGQPRAIAGSDYRTLGGIAGAPGTYTYEVIATSSANQMVANWTTLNITRYPTVSIIPNTTVTLDQGETYQFRSTYSPGAGNASYIWNVSKLGVSSRCLYPANAICVVTTNGVKQGSYPVSVIVKDGTEGVYPIMVSTNVVVNTAPTLIAAPTISNVLIGGNVIYGVTIVNGTGPFNITVYTENGIAVGSTNMAITNQTETIIFPTPSKTTSYYAQAIDLGTIVPYSFNSAVSTVSVPASASVNSILIGIIVVLVVIIVIVLAYNVTRGRGGDDDFPGSSSDLGGDQETLS